METAPIVGNAVAHRRAASIVDACTAEGSTVRFCNANGFEVVTLKSNSVSKRFEPLFDERPVGTRRSEDGRLYAILKDGDSGLFRERSRLAALNTTRRPGAPRRERR